MNHVSLHESINDTLELNRLLRENSIDYRYDLTDLIENQNNIQEVKRMIINNSIEDIKQIFSKHPELLLRESFMTDALKKGSDQVVVLLIKLGVRVPGWCFVFPTHRMNLLHAAGIDICHEGCKHGRPSQKEIGKTAFNAVKIRLMEICIGLQDLELDANRLMHIVHFDGLPFTNQIPLHLLWNLVTTVKHFHDRQRKLLGNFFQKKQEQKNKMKSKNKNKL
jgi:hypothetical protein